MRVIKVLGAKRKLRKRRSTRKECEKFHSSPIFEIIRNSKGYYLSGEISKTALKMKLLLIKYNKKQLNLIY